MSGKVFVGRVFDAKWAVAKLVLEPKDLELLREKLVGGKAAILIKESKEGKKYAEIDTYMSMPTHTSGNFNPNE